MTLLAFILSFNNCYLDAYSISGTSRFLNISEQRKKYKYINSVRGGKIKQSKNIVMERLLFRVLREGFTKEVT